MAIAARRKKKLSNFILRVQMSERHLAHYTYTQIGKKLFPLYILNHFHNSIARLIISSVRGIPRRNSPTNSCLQNFNSDLCTFSLTKLDADPPRFTFDKLLALCRKARHDAHQMLLLLAATAPLVVRSCFLSLSVVFSSREHANEPPPPPPPTPRVSGADVGRAAGFQ